MKFNEHEIREKLFQAIDPNTDYTLEEFNNEFTNVSHTAGTFETPKIPVKFVNKSNNQDPEYQTSGAAGFDFRANLEQSVILYGSESAYKGNNVAIIPTGLYFELPETLELQVRPRSGLAAKHAVTVLNSPGTIDSDYRGEVKVILINHGKDNFEINNGDRIAQGVIAVVSNEQFIRFEKVDELNDNTERGDKGFGSTGVK